MPSFGHIVHRVGKAMLAGAAALARWRNRRRCRNGRPGVIFLGDSITRFWLEQDPGFFLAGDRVNAGMDGETSGAMRARFAADVAALRPRLVHIMAGTNDLWHGDPGPQAADTIANIAAMAAMARAAGIAVVIAAPPPISAAAARSFGHAELHAGLCAAVSDLCRRSGLVHVDYARSLAGTDGEPIDRFTTDGVHLTRRGYLALRRQAGAALRAGLDGGNRATHRGV